MSNVCVIGMGVVCCNASNTEQYKTALINGINGIDFINSYDTENEIIKIAGEVKDVNFRDYMSKKTLRRAGRASKLAIVAVRQAIEDAKIDVKKYSEQIAIIVGTAIGEKIKELKYYDRLKLKYKDRVSPYFMLFSNDAISAYIAIELKIKGINFSISCGCSSSNVALIEGVNLIKSKRYKYVIVCGVEAPIYPYILESLYYTGILAHNNNSPSDVMKPFDRNADGFVISEGAGALILADADTLETSNNDPYCNIIGTGYYCDAFSMTSEPPDFSGKVKAIQNALKEANLSYSEIEYINAYGCGLKHIDITEMKLINETFRERTKNLYVSSTKSMIGHALGASAMLENISVILGLKYNFIVPTINIENKYEEYDLNFVANKSIEMKYNRALKLSYATGNKDTAIIFERV